MPASTAPEVPRRISTCSICGKPVELVFAKPTAINTVYVYLCGTGHRHEVVAAGNGLLRLYINLAGECFNKAEMTIQSNEAEALWRMGHCYIAEARALA